MSYLSIINTLLFIQISLIQNMKERENHHNISKNQLKKQSHAHKLSNN